MVKVLKPQIIFISKPLNRSPEKIQSLDNNDGKYQIKRLKVKNAGFKS